MEPRPIEPGTKPLDPRPRREESGRSSTGPPEAQQNCHIPFLKVQPRTCASPDEVNQQKGIEAMSFMKQGLAALTAGAIGISLAAPAAAEPVKFDFWYGLSGDLARVVQTMCDNFNASQSDYQVV
jgi:hypothetical protein